jgi:hypothetical protein
LPARKDAPEENTKYMTERRMMKRERRLEKRKRSISVILIYERRLTIEWCLEKYHSPYGLLEL